MLVRNLLLVQAAEQVGLAEFSNIDFLKIDVEGLELEVLLGASSMLREHRIKHIQFEMREYSEQLVNVFKEHGYAISPHHISYNYYATVE